MEKNMEQPKKYKKSVSNLLNKSFTTPIFKNWEKKGNLLHEQLACFYTEIFKTSDRWQKKNYRKFSQRVTKVYNDILSNVRISKDYKLWYEDLKFLLNTHRKEILQIARPISKENYGIIITEEIEQKIFGGTPYFETDASGKIGGITIPARVDQLIELNESNFKIRDFNSSEYKEEIEPSKPDSPYYRKFMQICIYGIIYEQDRNQGCQLIQILFYPNHVVSYKFTSELRELALEFVKDTAFEGFNGVSFSYDHNYELTNPEEESVSKESQEKPQRKFSEVIKEADALGSIYTDNNKPLELIRGKDNKIKGYLSNRKAHLVKERDILCIETDKGSVLIGPTERIECSEDHFPGITSSHKEENYKIVINPEQEITPEGIAEVRPQTIIKGKIRFPTMREYYLFKNLPLNGMPIGTINCPNAEYPYYLDLKLLYQSTFIGGVQGTGKTSGLRYLTLKWSSLSNAPLTIIQDNEGEYINLPDIPTNEKSKGLMKQDNIRELTRENCKILSLERGNGFSLTFKAIDPLDLPFLLRELYPATYDALNAVIDDIKEDNCGKEFTLLELKRKILVYIEKKEYSIAHATKEAIKRSLISPVLKLFDVKNAKPIDLRDYFSSGQVLILNTKKLRDKEQRIISIYLLALLHNLALKGELDIGVLLILDEVQRLIPKSNSGGGGEYLKRIIGFLDEIIHRGRKRDYGVIFATQSPADVKKEIIDLCNNKLFFQITGEAVNKLKEYLNKDERERLKRLPQGHAYILSKGKHEPIEIKFPYLN